MSPRATPTLDQLAARMAAVEQTTANLNTQFIGIIERLARVDVEIVGIREQAKAHNESQTKALLDQNLRLDKMHESTQTLVSTGTRELQEGMDKIISALGIDEEPNAAYTLRYDLKFLKGLRKGREEFWTTVWKAAVGLAVTGVATLLVIGVYEYMNNPR